MVAPAGLTGNERVRNRWTEEVVAVFTRRLRIQRLAFSCKVVTRSDFMNRIDGSMRRKSATVKDEFG
jgi:hypothetical protein